MFSSNENGHIFVEPIQNAFKTKHVNKICKIVLDNEEEIKCTLDHKFMLRDGTYKEAQFLTPDDSLMPLYTELRNGMNLAEPPSPNGRYEIIIHNDSGIRKSVHQTVAQQYLNWKKTTGIHIHHVDFDSRNNYPENLILMDAHEHLSMHAKRSRFLVKAHQRKMKEDPEYRQKIIDRLPKGPLSEEQKRKISEGLRKSPIFKEACKKARNTPERNRKHAIAKRKAREKHLADLLHFIIVKNPDVVLQKIDKEEFREWKNIYCNETNDRFTTTPGYRSAHDLMNEYNTTLDEWIKTYNHRIKSVEVINEECDVYDLTVSPFNNFALSAGVFVHNSAKSARWKEFQAVLPLRGKILNVSKADISKILNSEIIKGIFAAIGGGVGKTFDVNNIRYDKIIILTDADVDGSHIKSLLLTLFYYYMPELIKSGHVYTAIPPLYRIIKKDTTSVYLSDDLTLAKYRAEHANENYTLSRFKGLGEMNPQELKETVMNPQLRTLMRITIEDAEEAAKTFEILMGKDASKRKTFIEENAFSADISSL